MSDKRHEKKRVINVGSTERLVSMASGAVISLYGLRRGFLLRPCFTLAGTYLMLRGMTGICPIYEKLGLHTVGGLGLKGRNRSIEIRAAKE